MQRVSLKVVGAQGQGVNSVGEMCAKGLKRAGYCVFGYREYMSLIRGGHSSYQLDIASNHVRSSETHVDVVVCFNNNGIRTNLHDLKESGILIHQTAQWKFSPEEAELISAKHLKIIELPTIDILRTLNAKPILGNVLITAVVWAILKRKPEELKELVTEQFGHKKDLLTQNFSCIEEGFAFHGNHAANICVILPEPNAQWCKQLLLTGSHAMGLGIVHAGCRLYAGYPMTPSSPLLTYIADLQNETGMTVKQAEDEITAAQMMVGAMHMGTRAITATSGGGFDLMTETLSLAGITETPAVFVLAQRPGPGTGLPTWTAQGDLLLAVHAGHGEFPRLVLAPGNSIDSFDLMPEAFNKAEEFQIPVIVLTDKHLAEALFTQKPYDQKRARLRRGSLVTDPVKLKTLKASDRYDPSATDGISLRWLPGSEAATYCAQGDEHDNEGNSVETAENATEQMRKRMKKMEALAASLPEPDLSGSAHPEILIVSWGSTKGVVEDILGDEVCKGRQIAHLHYAYLWPLKTQRFEALAKTARRVVCVECNHTGQLSMLLKRACGTGPTDQILKADGRPFFYDELKEKLLPFLRP
ncbi:MAG: 2-oxoacid:acceptor oxidoreductase subunit alpha [Candidatus Peribacteraceae bacterium]|nr:2-oxoacid:acceptor oxidoreductase subunit alpha [Candidatus Peribacteraceae bacterium]